MIVLHGGRGQGQHGGVFAANQPLAGRYRLIGFDRRGHGHSSLTPLYTFKLSRTSKQVRQTLGGGRKMVLSGGSFGGLIALSYAVKYPQHLSHLILRGTAPSYRHEIEAVGNFQARAAHKAPVANCARVHNDLYRPEVWQRYDVLDRLHQIPVPTLDICGESDWICDPAQSCLNARYGGVQAAA